MRNNLLIASRVLSATCLLTIATALLPACDNLLRDKETQTRAARAETYAELLEARLKKVEDKVEELESELDTAKLAIDQLESESHSH